MSDNGKNVIDCRNWTLSTSSFKWWNFIL